MATIIVVTFAMVKSLMGFQEILALYPLLVTRFEMTPDDYFNRSVTLS